MATTMLTENNSTPPSFRPLKAVSFLHVVACTLLIASSPDLTASDWKFQPTLSVTGNFTDNVDLSPDNEDNSLITQVTPGFSLSKSGSHLRANIKYGLQWAEAWSGDGSDFSEHQLNATANAELIDDHLFVDASSTVSQQLISNRSSSTGNPINNNDDFATTTTFSISPYWRQRIGDDLVLNARLTYDDVFFGDGVDQDSGGFTFSTSVDYSADSTPGDFHWTVDLNNSRISADSADNINSDRISLSAGYRLTSKLDTTLTYGYVDNHIDNPTDGDADASDFWGARIDWNPTSRTQIRANYNSSLTDEGHGLIFNHRRRHTNWSVIYNENVSNTRRELLTLSPVGSLICPTTSSFSIADCRFVTSGTTPLPGPDEQIITAQTPIPSLVNDRFIQKSWTGNLTYSKGKSSYNLSLYSREREFQTGPLESEKDTGFSLGWNLRMNSRTSASIRYSLSELEPDNEPKDTTNSLTLSLSRRVDPDTTVSVTVNTNERDSDESTREYTENNINVSFNRTF